MDYEFIGGAYETFSKVLDGQECINWIPLKNSLRGTPGLKVFCDTSNYNEVRGFGYISGTLYSIVGNIVYKMAEYGTATTCIGNLNTSRGIVSTASNQTQLLIVDGKNGYIVDGITVTQITDDGFPGDPSYATAQDGYFIVSPGSNDRIYISDLNDGTSWDGTCYFSAESNPDIILSVISFKRNLFAFGSNSIERWYNSGETVPFSRIPGTTQQIGIGAKDSVVIIGNELYFLTNTHQIAKFSGNSVTAISPPSINYHIETYDTKNDAIGIGIENIGGHVLYILSFPTANETWGYEIISGGWFKLASYPEPFNNRWRGNCYTFCYGKHLVGDYENGKIYELDFNTFTDNDQTIRRVRTPSILRKENKNIFPHSLEILFEQGTGLSTGQGSDPKAMLQYSIDGCKTWSSEIWRDVGKMGEYKDRTIWNRFASGRNWTPRLIVSDPIKWVIIGANLEVELGIT